MRSMRTKSTGYEMTQRYVLSQVADLTMNSGSLPHTALTVTDLLFGKREIVAAAHLQPVTKEDMKRKHKCWNSIAERR